MEHPIPEVDTQTLEANRAFLQNIRDGKTTTPEQKALAERGLALIDYSRRLISRSDRKK